MTLHFQTTLHFKCAGESPDHIATDRPRPIQVSTILSYLAESCAYGYGTAQLPQLQKAARLGEAQTERTLMWRIHKAILELKEQGIRRVKDESGEEATYGQVKVCVWVMHDALRGYLTIAKSAVADILRPSTLSATLQTCSLL